MNAHDRLVERITERAARILTRPPVPVEASGRHVHLTRAAVGILFGGGYVLTRQADLSQPGQFACEERVRVAGPRGELPNVVVLGPERGKVQVEISATDAVLLGIRAPVRLSGDTAGTPGCRLIGPAGEISIDEGVIAAQRHIHMTPLDAAKYGIADGQPVSVYIWGGRSTTFNNVVVRVSPDFKTFMHLDYDEANACGFSKGMIGLLDV